MRAGGFVFVSGQPGVDPDTGEAAGPSFTEQARQAFESLDAAFFPDEPPPRMTMQVSLPHGLLISIGCTAIIDG